MDQAVAGCCATASLFMLLLLLQQTAADANGATTYTQTLSPANLTDGSQSVVAPLVVEPGVALSVQSVYVSGVIMNASLVGSSQQVSLLQLLPSLQLSLNGSISLQNTTLIVSNCSLLHTAAAWLQQQQQQRTFNRTVLQFTAMPAIPRVHIHMWSEPGLSADDLVLQCASDICPCAGDSAAAISITVASQQNLVAAARAVEAAPGGAGCYCSFTWLLPAASVIGINSTLWPDTGIYMDHNVTVSGGGMNSTGFDLQLQVGAFVLSPRAFFTAQNLQILNQWPLQAPYLTSILGWAWSFPRNNSNKYQVLVYNATVLVARDEFSYIAYWISILKSFDPNVAKSALWLYTLGVQVFNYNGSAASATSIPLTEYAGRGIHAWNLRLINQGGLATPLLSTAGYTALLTSNEQTLPYVVQVTNQQQLIDGLTLSSSSDLNSILTAAGFPSGTSVVLVVMKNVTLNRDQWPTGGLPLSNAVRIVGNPYSTGLEVLDWGDQVNYIVMKTSNAISFQDLALRQTGYQAPYALGASVLPSLSALMWGVSIARTPASQQLVLKGVTIETSTQEVELILMCAAIRRLSNFSNFIPPAPPSSAAAPPPPPLATISINISNLNLTVVAGVIARAEAASKIPWYVQTCQTLLVAIPYDSLPSVFGITNSTITLASLRLPGFVATSTTLAGDPSMPPRLDLLPPAPPPPWTIPSPPPPAPPPGKPNSTSPPKRVIPLLPIVPSSSGIYAPPPLPGDSGSLSSTGGSSSSSCTPGCIIAPAVAVPVFLLAVAAAAFYVVRARKRQQQYSACTHGGDGGKGAGGLATYRSTSSELQLSDSESGLGGCSCWPVARSAQPVCPACKTREGGSTQTPAPGIPVSRGAVNRAIWIPAALHQLWLAYPGASSQAAAAEQGGAVDLSEVVEGDAAGELGAVALGTGDTPAPATPLVAGGNGAGGQLVRAAPGKMTHSQSVPSHPSSQLSEAPDIDTRASPAGGPSGHEAAGDGTHKPEQQQQQQQPGVQQSKSGRMVPTSMLQELHGLSSVVAAEVSDDTLVLGEVLGSGAFSTVYHGTWQGLPVAVKSVVFSAARKQMALQEAALSRSVSHPNVVATYAYDIKPLFLGAAPGQSPAKQGMQIAQENKEQAHEWRLFIIQEYCAGGNLRAALEAGLTRSKDSQAVSAVLSPTGAAAPGQLGTGPTTQSPAAVSALASGNLPGMDQDSSTERSLQATAQLLQTTVGQQLQGTKHQVRHPTALDVEHDGRDASVSPSPGAGSQRNSPSPAVSHNAPRQLLLGGEQGMMLQHSGPPSTSSQAGVASASTVAGTVHMDLVISLALDVARGMAHLHSKNVVHGDLKPENVLLSLRPPSHPKSGDHDSGNLNREVPTVLPHRYTAKVADFGLAVKMEQQQSHVSNMLIGTPFYLAPEVQHGGRVTTSADVYSYGILLWELFHGMLVWTKEPNPKGSGFTVRYNPLFPKFLPGAPPAYMQLVRDATSSSLVRRPKFEAIIRTLEELQMSSGGARSGPLLPPSLSRGLSHASARNSGHAQPKQA